MIQSINKQQYELNVISNIKDDINELNTQLISIIQNMKAGIDSIEQIETLKHTFERVKSKPRHYSGPDKHNMERHCNSEWNCDIRDIRNEIETISDFENYCIHLIQNYNDVIILTNEQFRICQVVINDPTQVNRDISIYTDNTHTTHFSWEYNTGDIIDVFDQDDEYYYGITKRTIAVINKTNCQVLDHNVLTSTNTFILNDNIIQAILHKVQKLQRITTKTVLLFEHQTCLHIQKEYLNNVHNHIEPDEDEQYRIDYSDTCGICDSFKKGDYDINDSKLLFYMPDFYNTQDFTIRTIYAGYGLYYDQFTIVKRRLPNIMYENLISLLLSKNNFYQKTALVNFKCFFTKTVQEELELIKDITNTLETKNIKLINLFIPEIKFLLSNHLLQVIKPIGKTTDHRTPDYIKWLKYCEKNEVEPSTKPEFFLSYLFNVVLEHIISVKTYKIMLMDITELTQKLVVQLSIPGGSFVNSDIILGWITKQINRVIEKMIVEQKGGLNKLKSRKKKQIKKHSRRLYS